MWLEHCSEGLILLNARYYAVLLPPCAQTHTIFCGALGYTGVIRLLISYQ